VIGFKASFNKGGGAKRRRILKTPRTPTALRSPLIKGAFKTSVIDYFGIYAPLAAC